VYVCGEWMYGWLGMHIHIMSKTLFTIGGYSNVITK